MIGPTSTSLILFGVVTLLGGAMAAMLPETLGTKLPDNIDDVEFGGSSGDLVTGNGEEMKNLNHENPEDV